MNSAIERVRDQCIESLDHDDSWELFKQIVSGIIALEDRRIDVCKHDFVKTQPQEGSE